MVYSTKANALRGFRRTEQALADGKDNATITEMYLRYVAVGDGTKYPGPAGHGWIIEIPADAKKRYIYKGVPLRRRSEEPEGITSAVHDMFDEFRDEAEERGVTLKRKDFIAKAVKAGVAYYTARTQYQKWSKG